MSRNREIFQRRQAGARVTDIAKEFGLSKARISVICREQSSLREGGVDLSERLEAARLDLAKWRTINTEAAARLAELRLRQAQGELIPRDQVREMFNRVFSAYRQAIRELDRRYGPEAALLVIEAERRGLRVEVSSNDANTK